MSDESDARELLKAVKAQILAMVSGGVASYSRPGLSLTKLSLGELREMQHFAEGKLAQTKRGFYTLADQSGRGGL